VLISSLGESNWPASNEGNRFLETLPAPVAATAFTGAALILAKLNHAQKVTRPSIHYLSGYAKFGEN